MKKTSDNGYFIISPDHNRVLLEKVHFCTWNLPGGMEFLEVGMLIQLTDSFFSHLNAFACGPELVFKVFIPWYERDRSFGDLFSSLKNPENTKFVFNDQVVGTELLSDGSSTTRGVRFSFRKEKPFCLLPVVLDPEFDIPHTVSLNCSASPTKSFNSSGIVRPKQYAGSFPGPYPLLWKSREYGNCDQAQAFLLSRQALDSAGLPLRSRASPRRTPRARRGCRP